jgi:F-type H+-transporting ATPase subunit gamma
MPSLIDIRRRIRAVKSTQQITKAMKMVAASRMRRAYERIVHARPFSRMMLRVLYSLAARVDDSAHPLLADRDVNRPGARVQLIVVAGDKGLAGSFNSNVVKAAGTFIVERAGAQEVTLTLVGRKARDFFRRRGFAIRGEHVGIFSRLDSSAAHAIASAVIADFVEGRTDAVFIVYNEFKSIIAQKVVVEQLLPIPRAALQADMAAQGVIPTSAGSNLDVDRDGRIDEGSAIDYLYEPDPATIFAELLPQYVHTQVYHALLESNAAFYAAQMTAMEAATKNSAEMIDALTLYMNKVRQAAITREIIEVVSGAQAL